MIDKIMTQECFKDKPPVLVDVGASGDIHQAWRPIAKYSTCIAFDADERELEVSNDTGHSFKNFYLLNRIVANRSGRMHFYLTNSPYCSSALDTDLKSLEKYDIKRYFEVTKEIELEAITLNDALKSVDVDYIDWYKTDSQGTDLRIFSALDQKVISKILVAEFEPGIMDAYIGEDKLYHIMEFFETKSFWCDACSVKGLNRIDEAFKLKNFNTIEKRYFRHKPSAFWAEISYMNELEEGDFEKREYLLLSAFAILKKQYGFAIEVANRANAHYDDLIFQEIIHFSTKQIKWGIYKRLPTYFMQRLFLRVFKR